MADELSGRGASVPHQVSAEQVNAGGATANEVDAGQVNTVVEAQLDKAAEEVARRFGERVDQDVVRQAIGDAYGRLARRSRLVGFLPPVEVGAEGAEREGVEREGAERGPVA
ncbi:hypothetical protein [Saccharothrix sp. Mg75]|uniref:hypothetical protein n=1 Tax=Saccharothrix sp. Mg75 TaxID=3445357 RepID=UPI003EF000B5